MHVRTKAHLVAATVIAALALVPISARADMVQPRAQERASQVAGTPLRPANASETIETLTIHPRAAKDVRHFAGSPSKEQLQIVSVLGSPQASGEIGFDLRIPAGEVSMTPTPDGGLDILIGSRIALGKISPPWAKDSSGKSLPTRYMADGPVLRQIVDLEGAAFPVVADPKLTFGAGIYLNFYGAEAKALVSALAVGGFAACTFTSKLPTSLAKVASQVCTLLGLTAAKAVFDKILAYFRNNSQISNAACYQTKRVIRGAREMLSPRKSLKLLHA